jgi:hypothetical protein
VTTFERDSRLGALLIVSLVVAGCANPAARPAPQPESVGFVNRVWTVEASSSVSPGMMYVFLSDGTLVITSPNSRPAFGTWKDENGKLTMVEESLPYAVDVLALDANRFRIRVRNPGEPVEITFVRAEMPPWTEKEPTS